MLPEATTRATSSLSLADYTRPALIVPQLRKCETVGVIRELSELLHQEDYVPKVQPFFDAVLNRESLVNTAVEMGLAFPHGRLNGLSRLGFALGRSQKPLAWGSRGAEPVRLVFLMVVPATDAANYILLLSSLARLGRDAALFEGLLTRESPKEIYDLLRTVRVQPARSPRV